MRAVYFIAIIFCISITGVVFAQTEEEMFDLANAHFINGEYQKAIKIYDEILNIVPNNITTLTMKGIAQSNTEEHRDSLKQFFTILQHDPNNIVALTGMGVGFGNLGEYQEAAKYFKKALVQKPDSIVINNYKQITEKIITKYPYISTEKPKELEKPEIKPIPKWIRNLAGWWATSQITDDNFIKGLEYLIVNNIIQIPEKQSLQKTSKLQTELKDSAGQWAKNLISDEEFFKSIQWLIDNGFVNTGAQSIQKSQEQIDNKNYFFDKYLRDIANNISKEKRYIESPNPSQDVIKKFLRDYTKWNFDEEIKGNFNKFPDPTFEIIDGKHVINYKVYINEQPTGLPLDHVSTLENSFKYWESQEFTRNNQTIKIEFEITGLKHEANVWVTWVVRDIGEGVLGHANLGKGAVEVTLGDYNCDASFQLYDVNSIETIMTHELGHSIGLEHSKDKTDIMYPSLTPSYAYCLFS